LAQREANESNFSQVLSKSILQVPPSASNGPATPDVSRKREGSGMKISQLQKGLVIYAALALGSGCIADARGRLVRLDVLRDGASQDLDAVL
jgi:hypothetical protein